MNAPTGLLTAVRVADLRDAAERARLAAFVFDHPDGTPFHLPEWGIATARGCGQRFAMLVAERADGSLAGLVPLTSVGSPLFGRALVSAGFGVGGGILARDEGARAALAQAVIERAAAENCPTIELRGGPVPATGWTSDDERYVGFVRDLAADDAAELLAIPRKQRAEVRRALGNDLPVSVGRGADDLRAHYRVYSESVRNLGTPVFPRALFAQVLRAFGEDADILTVRHDGRAVASVLSLYCRGTVYPYWGGGTAEARGLRANDAMYFALMRHAHARGCTRFDFGRSKVGTGAAAFKKNWGFVPEPLLYHVWTKDGAVPRDASPLNPRYRRKIELWQKLPLPVANLLGPMLARGLG